MTTYPFNPEENNTVKAFEMKDNKEEVNCMTPIKKKTIKTGLVFRGEASPRRLLQKISRVGIEALKHPLPRKGAYRDESGLFDYLKLEEILDQMNVLESEEKIWSTAYVDGNYAVIEVYDLEEDVSLRLVKEIEPLAFSNTVVTDDLSRETRYIRSLYRSVYKLTGYTEGDEPKDLDYLFKREDKGAKNEGRKAFMDPRDRSREVQRKVESGSNKKDSKAIKMIEADPKKVMEAERETKTLSEGRIPPMKRFKAKKTEKNVPKPLSVEDYLRMADTKETEEKAEEAPQKSLPPIETVEGQTEAKVPGSLETAKEKRAPQERDQTVEKDEFMALIKDLREKYGPKIIDAIKEEFKVKYISELSDEERVEVISYLKGKF